MKLHELHEQSNQIKWVKGPWANEQSEFERVSKDTKLSIEELRSAYENGILYILSDEIWAELDNTESFDIKSMKDLENIGTTYGRGIKRVMQHFSDGVVEAPVVLWLNNRYTLIAGNTRLCAARVLGVTPSVVLMHID